MSHLPEPPPPPPLPDGLQNVIDIRSFVGEPVAQPHDLDTRRRNQQAYRMAYRLLGDPDDAAIIVERVAARVNGVDGDLALRVAAQVTVEQARLHCRRPDHSFRVDDIHAAQRMRLIRDLDRHSAGDRVVLALRHLLGLAPGRVAMITGRSETDVRAVSGKWTPDDAKHSITMLTNIDTWIDPSLRERQLESVIPNLAHLDDPHAALLIPQVQT